MTLFPIPTFFIGSETFEQLTTKKLNKDDISKIKKQILNAKRNELFDLYSNSFISQIKNNILAHNDE